MYDARTLTSLAASEPFTARDGLTVTAASRERGDRRTPLLDFEIRVNDISEDRRPLIGGDGDYLSLYLMMIFNWEDRNLLIDYMYGTFNSLLSPLYFTLIVLSYRAHIMVYKS